METMPSFIDGTKPGHDAPDFKSGIIGFDGQFVDNFWKLSKLQIRRHFIGDEKYSLFANHVRVLRGAFRYAKVIKLSLFALEGPTRWLWLPKLEYFQFLWITLKIPETIFSLKFIKYILQIAIFLGLGLVLIWFSLKDLNREDIQHLKSLIYNANGLIVLLCALILVLSHYIRTLRWTTMISATGSKPGTLNVFLAVITGFFFNLVFPRLGEVMKCTVLGKYEKIPVDKLIGTMVAERIVDLFVWYWLFSSPSSFNWTGYLLMRQNF